MDVCVYVDRLAAIFRACSVKADKDHPARAAMTQVWPELSRLLTEHKDQLKIVERTCRSRDDLALSFNC